MVLKLMANGTMEEKSMFFSQAGTVKELLWTRQLGWQQSKKVVVDANAGYAVAAGDRSVYWQHRETGDIREARFNDAKQEWEMVEDKIA